MSSNTSALPGNKQFWHRGNAYDPESGGANGSQSGAMAIGDGVSGFATDIGGMFKNLGVRSGFVADTEAPKDLTEASYTDEFNELASLSPQQRLYGFLLALAMGAVFIWISVGFVLSGMIALFAKKFAFFFTCGNFFIICAPSFLVGPKRQLQTMTESHRLQAVGLYFGCTVMTLLSALYLHSSVLSVAFAVLQVLSVLWYGMSFIPFARQVLGMTFKYLGYFLRPLMTAVWMVVSQCLSCVVSALKR